MCLAKGSNNCKFFWLVEEEEGGACDMSDISMKKEIIEEEIAENRLISLQNT